MKRGGFDSETVAVLPTSTTVVEVDTRGSELYTLYVYNGTDQLLTGAIERYMATGQVPAPTAIGADLATVPAGQSRMADLDVSGTRFIRYVAYFDGAGGNVTVSGADRRKQP